MFRQAGFVPPARAMPPAIPADRWTIKLSIAGGMASETALGGAEPWDSRLALARWKDLWRRRATFRQSLATCIEVQNLT
jgi:hypothetical protein